jgi:hypothetical protein
MPADKRLRRAAIAGCGVAAVVVAAALVLSSSPDGALRARQDAAESRWESLARAMTAPWPGLQEASGRLGDYTDALPGSFGDHAGTRYGDAVMGCALIQAGVRERDRRLVRTGIRAISFATDPERRPSRPSVFEQLAVAAAYNVAREQLAGDPEFARHRARWEAWLRRVRIVELQYVNHYYNHWLVDAVGVLELQRTGLRSGDRRAVLGGGARRARRLAEELVNVRIPGLLPARGPAVLSDAPDNPLAYHGLSLGLYARAVQLLGDDAAPAARRVLQQGVWAAAVAMAPNGSLAYIGRSQEEVWSPAGAAYAAAFTAALPNSSSAVAAVARTVAQRSLARLERAYPVGPGGVAIVPAIGAGLRPGWRGLDGYAGAPSMGGLALMLLNWTLELRPDERAPGRLAADFALARTVSQGRGRMAVVRRGATWFAVKMSRSGSDRYRADLRYDAGLAYAMRRSGGRWRELVPQRPRTEVAGRASAGPVLVNGGPGTFFGHDIDAARDGTVRVSGEFRNWVGSLRAVDLVYRPVRCGVALELEALPGDVYRMSVFFSRRPRLTRLGASDGRQTVTAGADQVALELAPGTLASGERARLWRVNMVLGAQAARTLSVRHCAA